MYQICLIPLRTSFVITCTKVFVFCFCLFVLISVWMMTQKVVKNFYEIVWRCEMYD